MINGEEGLDQLGLGPGLRRVEMGVPDVEGEAVEPTLGSTGPTSSREREKVSYIFGTFLLSSPERHVESDDQSTTQMGITGRAQDRRSIGLGNLPGKGATHASMLEGLVVDGKELSCACIHGQRQINLKERRSLGES